MNRFRTVFNQRHVVLPIIHVVSRDQALRNLQVARETSCDGAFLISHGVVEDEELLGIYHELKKRVPEFWLGINCLGLSVDEVFCRAGSDVMGVWTDDALIDEAQSDQRAASNILDVQKRNGWQGLYFGGVAFKYQRSVSNLARAASLAHHFMDVVTTSGPGTAQAAPPEKVRTMKQAIGSHPLALSSGVTPENVTDYLPWVDCLMVATGISYTFQEIDPNRARDLVRIVRAWK